MSLKERKSILSIWEFIMCFLNEHRMKRRETSKLLKPLTYSLRGQERMNFLISSKPLMTLVPSFFNRGSAKTLHCIMILKTKLQEKRSVTTLGEIFVLLQEMVFIVGIVKALQSLDHSLSWNIFMTQHFIITGRLSFSPEDLFL